MDPLEIPLKDIHLPPPVSWWPPAPGWWVLAGLVLLAALAAFAWWQGRAARRLRRAALEELDTAWESFDRDGDAHALARRASRLARQVGLALRGRSEAAATAEPWWRGPDAGAADALDSLLAAAPYSPGAAAQLSREDCARARAGLDHAIRQATKRARIRPARPGATTRAAA